MAVCGDVGGLLCEVAKAADGKQSKLEPSRQSCVPLVIRWWRQAQKTSTRRRRKKCRAKRTC
jgi:hypothetical protein